MVFYDVGEESTYFRIQSCVEANVDFNDFENLDDFLELLFV